ncbi:hypothetical protein M408DRAFT_279258 [Serendipita vermifera MAFF 305830]|uniref:PNPLA domain-containing protein n=1 Tax=Serendipita vermifera MAFF 305830 TaxID=933852 RepID=A0A0C3AU19_SERVB|nr:hypothetical protein M408DRAFT_279258 [Serendipita vermifera MAFF 305830]
MNEKNKHHEDDGISILSLDSGGPSVYSQLLILKEYMARLAGDLDTKEEMLYPADFFDLMGGAGFGALIAIMLGHLRMTADEAIEALHTLASTVFPESLKDVTSPEQRTNVLKEAIEHILYQKGELPDTKMYEENRPPARCKVILYAVTAVDITHPRAFRTYPSRGSSLNPSIVDAICATIAVPSHFSPVKIGPENRQQTFVGGSRGANNPTRLLLNEASNIFGKDKRVAQIVSIGSGLANVLSLDGLAEGAGVARLLNEMAADCQLVAQELATRLFHVEAYLRLNRPLFDACKTERELLPSDK